MVFFSFGFAAYFSVNTVSSLKPSPEISGCKIIGKIANISFYM